MENEVEYKLEQDKELSWGITGDLNNIIAVDPCGGPYITEGYKCDDYIVDKIKYDKGIKFILKKL